MPENKRSCSTESDILECNMERPAEGCQQSQTHAPLHCAVDLRRNMQKLLDESSIQFVHDQDCSISAQGNGDDKGSVPKFSETLSCKDDTDGQESSESDDEDEVHKSQTSVEFFRNLASCRRKEHNSINPPIPHHSITVTGSACAAEDGEPFPEIPEIPSVIHDSSAEPSPSANPPIPPLEAPPAASIGAKTLYASAARWSLPLRFEEVLREGWLHKERGSWTLGGGQRWFTARPGALVYVRWPGDRRPARPIPLAPAARVSIAAPARAGGAYTVEIEHAGRTHRLRHHDRQEAFEWMRAIARAAATAAPAAPAAPAPAGPPRASR